MATDKLNNKKIAIIGMGHLGKAFKEGLLRSGLKQENIFVSNISANNKKVATIADWILIAVKPALVAQVLTEIKECLSGKIIISVAAGMSVATLEKYYGNQKQKIIRLMPNLPIAYGQGVIGLYANKNVSMQEKKSIMTVLSDLGKVFACESEQDLDAFTIIAGSGPALVAYFISLLEKSGQTFGLQKEHAEQIALQTFIGTLAYLRQTEQTASQLQESVATKGGVTEAIINSLDKERIPQRFVKSLEAGYAKIKKIGSDLKK